MAKKKYAVTEELEKKLANAEAENATLKAENELLKDQLKVMTSGAKPGKRPQKEREVFEYDGEKYEVLAGGMIPKKGKMTALDIACDEETQAWLIKNNSGLIKKLA